MTEYSFVKDIKGNKLSPTKVNKAWYLIRKKRAILVSKYPIVVQLTKEIKDEEKDNSEFVVGVDDGSKNIGIAIVQKCKTKNKVVFKGVIEQRKDVKQLIDVRRGYRKYHRQHKRYRPIRFNNCASSKRKGRITPSIKQKKDAILRVINRLNHWCNIYQIILEDVQIDIRKLQEGKKLYRTQYQKSNRLDENIRKATIFRDSNKCMECGKSNCMLEVHHIVPKRMNGNNTLDNLITLCVNCHDKTKDKEEKFIIKYQKLINGKNIRFDFAQHVMQGKTYLRYELNNIAPLKLTIGSETANQRINWSINKSHSNDAIVITGLKPNTCDIKEWIIKPIRRQSKAKCKEVEGFKHRDLVTYIDSKKIKNTGYITALYPKEKQINIQTQTKHWKRCGYKKCSLIWRFEKIYWLCV